MWRPTILLAGPASAKAFLIAGSIKRLYEEKDFFSDVQIFAGVSAGAAMTLLLVCGYSIDEIIDLCMDLSIVDDIASINLDEAREKLGLIRNQTIEKTLYDAITKKIGFIPTLKQLYCITGVEWTAVAFNVDKMKGEFFNKDNEPDMSVLELVMMSMCVPILIQPRKYKGYNYVDGALTEPLPILHFDRSGHKILALHISAEEDLSYSDQSSTTFFYRLIHAGMSAIKEFNIQYSSENVKYIPLKTNIKDITGLTLSKETRQKMVDYGYACSSNFLKINSDPEKYTINLGENEEIPFQI
jgi:predicted acylesterase/phospholipase RssA